MSQSSSRPQRSPSIRLIPYQTFLGLPRETPGLSGSYAPEIPVRTEASDKINRLLARIKGGTIGIAGPRGSGKTTLLQSFGPTDLSISRLYVEVAAPVQYEARDFILHLFSKLCTTVIDPESTQTDSMEDLESAVSRSSAEQLNRSLLPILKLAAPIAATVSVTLLVLAWIIPLIIVQFAKESSSMGWGGYFRILLQDGGPFLRWGLISGALGVGLWIYRGRAGVAERGYRPDSLVERASEHLRRNKFQQSYSAGYSGSLTLPLGLQGGLSGAVSLTATQESLPDIVARYRRFVRDIVGQGYLTIIAIDELDKMESDEKAMEFLNQIKVIFGSGAFYLTSVSESAIGRFERRGLPFRDVFDSSFDDIIYTNYLTFDKAREILDQRVIGLEIPFLALCYCLSSGLARELIRACRDMYDLVEVNPQSNQLQDVSYVMITSDLDAKLQGLSLEAHQTLSIGESDTTEYLKTLSGLRQRLRNRLPLAELQTECESLARSLGAKSQENRPKWALLVGYLYFSETLLEFFQLVWSATRWRDEHTSSSIRLAERLQSLVRVRQLLAVNPDASLALLAEHRQSFP